MDPVLTICIPTLHNPEQLGWCLTSLLKHTDYPYKIVVVDNGCAGLVKEDVKSLEFEHIEVLEPDCNLGWMGSINLALEQCDTMLFCMMNDDVCFLPGQKEYWRVLTTHLGDGRVGSVGPCSNYVAGTQSLMELTTPDVFDASLIIGVCNVMRTDTLKELGGLDESLPGGDDLDLSMRLLQAGMCIRIDKRAFLYHAGQQTGKRVQGEHWNSQWMQELTNNALVKKHGFKAWYECYQASWKDTDAVDAVLDEHSEHDWYEEQLEAFGGKIGVSLGCGSDRLGETVGLDVRKNGSSGGAGGAKQTTVDSDVTAHAESIPYMDSTQDYIVAGHVLEHLIDPESALAEWRRVLKSDGKLFLTAPNHELLQTMLIDYTHVHAYTPVTLKRLLFNAGFIVEFCESHAMGAIRIVASKSPVPSARASITKMEGVLA